MGDQIPGVVPVVRASHKLIPGWAWYPAIPVFVVQPLHFSEQSLAEHWHSFQVCSVDAAT